MSDHLGLAPAEVRMMDPLAGEWDKLVASHPQSTVFHSAAWARVLIATYHHRPCYLAFFNHGQPAALLSLMEVNSRFTGRRGVALPFSDFCPPLIFGEIGPATMLEKLSEFAQARRWDYFELRGAPTFGSSMMPTATFYGHQLDLRAGAAALFRRCASSVRRAIRKAERSGLIVAVSHAPDAMLQFYALHVRTRRRHGLPPQPVSFFLNIFENIIKAGLGFVVLAHKGTRVLAGAVFFHQGENAVYKFGASDERYQEYRANNLVMWEGIQFLVAEGATSLSFGRTAPGDAGLRRFKTGWGAQEETIEYYRSTGNASDSAPAHHDVPTLATTFFGRMPLSVNKLIGAMLYPHMD